MPPDEQQQLEQAVQKALEPLAKEVHDLKLSLTSIRTQVANIDRFVTGNGEPGKGAIVRLDRLEQKEKSRTFWTNTALAAGITAFIGSVLSFILKH